MGVGGVMKIGQVVRRTGLTVDAIRFYEREGLLPERRRTEGGYRIFDQGDIQRLAFIVKAQELGFSLREIRELLLLRSSTLHACSEVQTLLERKLVGVREKIQDLSALEDSLQSALRKCRRELKRAGKDHAECCPVLEEIGQPEL